jgi:hypothetical protein
MTICLKGEFRYVISKVPNTLQRYRGLCTFGRVRVRDFFLYSTLVKPVSNRGFAVTIAQLTIVEKCNSGMRYYAERARFFYTAPYKQGNAARVVAALAEFDQIRALRDYIRFGR